MVRVRQVQPTQLGRYRNRNIPSAIMSALLTAMLKLSSSMTVATLLEWDSIPQGHP